MKKNENKFGLIEEDKKTIDIVDTRNIVNLNNYLDNRHKKLFEQKNSNFFKNIDNSLLINVYLDKKNKNRRKKLKEKYNKTKEFNIKKPIYNFYCGSPKIINNEHKSNSKYDFVPNELFNEIKK